MNRIAYESNAPSGDSDCVTIRGFGRFWHDSYPFFSSIRAFLHESKRIRIFHRQISRILWTFPVVCRSNLMQLAMFRILRSIHAIFQESQKQTNPDVPDPSDIRVRS